MRAIKLTCAVVAVSLFPKVNSYAADAAHGLDLAKRWCASCHVVSPDQQSASADVPPFTAIANSPNFDPKRLAYFLLEPHPKMPQMALSLSATDDIATYIQSMKR